MQMPDSCRALTGCVALSLFAATPAIADRTIVDKIYSPYVETLERELEYRIIVLNDEKNDLEGAQKHRLGGGLSWAEHWYSEMYAIGNRKGGNDLKIDAWELETKWQMTEQGEYWADWGLQFELEGPFHGDIWEYSTKLLTSKEFGRWIATTNLGVIYEWGHDVRNEWETSLSLQSRYRLTRGFEPALELYLGENTKSLGPAFAGSARLGARKKLRWEAGVFFGLDSVTADQTYRGTLEYEF